MVTILKIVIRREFDEYPDLSYLTQSYEEPSISPEEAQKYREQDKVRMAKYGDTWWMLGIFAEAHLEINGTHQVIRTPGLWGIESDSDEDYMMEVGAIENDNLKDLLMEINLTEAQIDESITEMVGP